MKESHLISIIVPVYRSELFIRRCLDSILKQSYSNYEVIMIDDGSDDSSYIICQEYCEKDKRFKLSKQENQGISSARNKGLALATGEYIAWVDSDDYIEKNMLWNLINAIDKTSADLAICGYQRVYENQALDKINTYFEAECISQQQYLEKFVKHAGSYYFGVLWNKLYHREILVKNQIHFENDINFGEDFIFNLKVIKYCKTIANVQECAYNYIVRKESIANQKIAPLESWIRTKSLYLYYSVFLKDFSNVYDKELLLAEYLQANFLGLMAKMRVDKLPFLKRISYIKKIYKKDFELRKAFSIDVHYNKKHLFRNVFMTSHLFMVNEIFYLLRDYLKHKRKL